MLRECAEGVRGQRRVASVAVGRQPVGRGQQGQRVQPLSLRSWLHSPGHSPPHLGEAGEEGAGHHHARQQLGHLLGVVPLVVARGGRAARHACASTARHRWLKAGRKCVGSVWSHTAQHAQALRAHPPLPSPQMSGIHVTGFMSCTRILRTSVSWLAPRMPIICLAALFCSSSFSLVARAATGEREGLHGLPRLLPAACTGWGSHRRGWGTAMHAACACARMDWLMQQPHAHGTRVRKHACVRASVVA